MGRHWDTIVRMTNTMLLHAGLSKNFFYYTVKYAQRVYGVIPVRGLLDTDGLPTTPHQMTKCKKSIVRCFKVFAYPTIF